MPDNSATLPPDTTKTCTFDGCTHDAVCKSLCQSHYAQLNQGVPLNLWFLLMVDGGAVLLAKKYAGRNEKRQ